MIPEQKEHIQYLLARYLNGTIAANEEQQLFKYIDEEKDNEAWQELLEEFIASEQAIIINKEEYKPILDSILSKRRAKILGIGWKRWVAAACIILVTGYGLWVMSERKATRQQGNEATVVHDVPAPSNTRAVITLADGSKVYLDSVNNGTIAQENNVNVTKTEDGKIIYSHEGTKIQSEIVYNTLTNPRGSKVINMQLSDGSHVWLNAGSSVTYPVAFVGNERKVEITGEAYFEVTHDATKPFIVSKGETSVTVLGTHFNINAYDDEESLKVTLLEGSVKVNAANKTVTIKPGEQAQVNGGNAIGLVVNRGVDVDEVMAWKNGMFQFNDMSIDAIMRQVEKWYDVDVVYQGKVSKTFKGEIPRDVSASELFEILESAGWVHFKIEGKKVTVLPRNSK